MDRKKVILHYSLSIVFVSIFLILSTCFIFLPRQKDMMASLSYLGKMNALSFEEKSDNFALAYNFPISDEIGKTIPAYEFQVSNNGNEKVKYQLTFTTGTTKDKVDANAIRYMINIVKLKL